VEGSQGGRRRAIRWAEDVVDNEGLGRKSSKVCCIYHKPRAVGESSSEEDSSDSEDSSSSDDGGGESGSESPDDGRARMVGGGKGGKRRPAGRGHRHGDDCVHGHGKGGRKRKPSPNAYEKMPRSGRKS
jgi:protein phosphatase 1 regulatory subunit 11